VMGAQARLMSQACRKLTSAMGQNNCTVIFINQIREKIGVMFGNPETTTGGRALRFFASVRMEVRKSETLKDKGGQETGNKVKVKVVKNKVSPPFRTGEGEIWFGEGFRRESSILDLAVEKDLIKRAGAWYSYEGEKVGQGRDNAIAHLMENQNLTNSLEDILRKDLFGE
jgi:recombination protein RecA